MPQHHILAVRYSISYNTLEARANFLVNITCAIVGGIVSCYTGLAGIPPAWLQSREPLPGWHK
ncbi:MAG: hypothetical protein OJF49_003819 [Ktedonobacterales bacterium]|jgi:hypothetical protein|nr:MAG: hypothetical protein OJF49_003819 [Ktedonobacterales bacterium]